MVAVVNSQYDVMDNRCKASGIAPSHSAEHDLLANCGGGKKDTASPSVSSIYECDRNNLDIGYKPVFLVLQICLLLQHRESVNIYLTDISQDLIFCSSIMEKKCSI